MNDLLMQIQADITNTTVVRPSIVETTALGAAYLAGLAVGYWNDPEDVKSNWQVDNKFVPQINADERAKRIKGWNRALRAAKAWAEED